MANLGQSTHLIKLVLDKSEAKKAQDVIRLIGEDATKSFTQAKKLLSVDVSKITKGAGGEQFRQLTSVYKDADGILRTFTTTQRLSGKEWLTLASTAKSAGGAVGEFSKSIKAADGGLIGLVKRAALTIPVWLALRAAVMGVMQGFSGGFASMIELDAALNKARVAMGGTISEIKAELATLKPAIEKMSNETGQSIASLGEAFFSFRASGLDFETSLGGMGVSNVIAKTQMGDIKKVAEGLAKTMLLLGDSFESGGTSVDKMNKIAALSYELNIANAFSVDQLTDSMLAFAPTAKTAGLSAEQAMKIVATVNSAGIMASSAGRTLSTGLSKFVSGFKELTPLLGIKVDPKLGTYNALMMTLEALKRLNAEGTLNPEFNNAINELFGGEKGGKTIKALVSVYDLLQKNNALTGDIEKMNKAYQDVNDSISEQIKIFHSLRDSVWRAFVVGVVGGEDFAGAMKNINGVLEKTVAIMKNAADNSEVLLGYLLKIAAFKYSNPVIAVGAGAVEGITNETEIEKLKKSYSEIVSAFNDEISKGLAGQLTIPQLEITIKKLDTKTAKAVFGAGTLEQLRTNLEVQWMEQKANLAELEKETAKNDKSENAKKQLQTGSEQEKLAKLLVQDELDRLKALGATNSELLRTKTILNQQFGIYDSILEKAERELDIRRAIREEKEKEVQKGPSSIGQTLFKVAQTEGVDIAKQLGEFFTGDVSFRDLERRSAVVFESLKKNFNSIFESNQAKQFLSGETVSGMPELRGGSRIPLLSEDEWIRGKPKRSKTLESDFENIQLGLPLQKQIRNEDSIFAGSFQANRFVPSGQLSDSVRLQSLLKEPQAFATTQAMETKVQNSTNVNYGSTTINVSVDTGGEGLTEEKMRQLANTIDDRLNKRMVEELKKMNTPGTRSYNDYTQSWVGRDGGNVR